MNLITENFYLSPGSYVLKIQTEKEGLYGVVSLGKYRSWVTFENPYVTISGESDVNFSISPPLNKKAGVYEFPIMVYLIENDSFYSIKNYNLLIEEKSDAKITEMKLNKDMFSPEEKIEVSGVVKNTGTADLEELRLYIKMEKPGYEEVREKVFSLNVGEEKELKETFETSIYSEPGTYQLSLTLSKFGQKLDSSKRFIEIEKIGKIDKVHDSSWNLLEESGSFYLKNVGNVEKTEKIEMEIAKPWDWFVFFSEMPQIKDSATRSVYVWEVTLKPGENKIIKYDIHYWPFAIIFIVLIYGLYLSLRHVRRPNIKKHFIQTKVLEDDRREVMVALEIKSSAKSMKDVIVEDRIPPMAQLIKDFKTISPSIKQSDEGTVLRWRLNDLGKNENIILSYKFRTLIGTLDHFKLPKAVLKVTINKIKREYFSNSLIIKEK